MTFNQTPYDEVLPSEFWGPWIDVPDSVMSCPTDDPDSICQVHLYGALNASPLSARSWYWSNRPKEIGRILKYRLLMVEKSDVIQWAGGDCPIKDGSNYFAILRNGTEILQYDYFPKYIYPGSLNWNHTGKDSDVVGYGFLVPTGSHRGNETELDKFRKFFSSNPVM